MNRVSAHVTLLCLAATAACATTTANYDRPAPVVVRVTNESWAVAAVYVVSGEVARRIATTPALSTELVRLPFDAFDNPKVTILVKQVGESDEFRSEPLRVPPGGRVELAIGALLRVSRASVF